MVMNGKIGIWLMALFSFFIIGCRPTAREVAGFLKTIPIGISRDEVWRKVEGTYGEEMRKYGRGFYGVSGLTALDKGWIEINQSSIETVKKDGKYYKVHPDGLLEKLSANGFFETVWFVADVKYGNGRVELFYDSNTNYMGFLAYSFLEKIER
jgi:hypothetical protein